MIFDLVKDFANVLEAMPKEHPRRRILKLLDEAICRDVHFIDRHPTTFFQCMWNTCWWYDCPEAAKHYEEPEGGWQQLPPWDAQPAPMHQLLDEWQDQSACLFRPWLRARFPPPSPLGTSQKAVFRGHKKGVTCVVASSTGRLIASSSRDGTIRVWDSITGREIGCIHVHEWGVSSITFSPDGTKLVSSCLNGTIQVWDVATHAELVCIPGGRGDGHIGEVFCTDYSYDGHWIVRQKSPCLECGVRWRSFLAVSCELEVVKL